MPAKASTGTTAPLALPAGRSVVVCVMEEGLQAGVRRVTWDLNLVCAGNYSVALAP
jgi:hypothetical protein